jgi:hypothetical protein
LANLKDDVIDPLSLEGPISILQRCKIEYHQL